MIMIKSSSKVNPICMRVGKAISLESFISWGMYVII